MNAITKISEITAADVAEYLRLPDVDEGETQYINNCINVALAFILNYTGIADVAALDKYADMPIVLFVLCQDMYDNRSLEISGSNVNKVVETILGMHQVNLL